MIFHDSAKEERRRVDVYSSDAADVQGVFLDAFAELHSRPPSSRNVRRRQWHRQALPVRVQFTVKFRELICADRTAVSRTTAFSLKSGRQISKSFLKSCLMRLCHGSL